VGEVKNVKKRRFDEEEGESRKKNLNALPTDPLHIYSPSGFRRSGYLSVIRNFETLRKSAIPKKIQYAGEWTVVLHPD